MSNYSVILTVLVLFTPIVAPADINVTVKRPPNDPAAPFAIKINRTSHTVNTIRLAVYNNWQMSFASQTLTYDGQILTDLVLNSVKTDETKTDIVVVVARLLPEQQKNVVVVDINGKAVKGFHLNPSQSVEYIKQLLEGVIHTPPENQSLIFEEQELKDINGMLPPALKSGNTVNKVRLVIKTRTGSKK